MTRSTRAFLGLFTAAALTSGCFYFTIDADEAPPDAAPRPDAEPLPDTGLVGPCPTNPAPGKFLLCGRLLSLETSAAIMGEAIDVAVFDALGYANNPQNATPIAGPVPIDPNGRFSIETRVPATGYVVLAIDDSGDFDGTPSEGRFIPTGHAVGAAANMSARINGWVARRNSVFAPYVAAGALVSIALRAPLLPIPNVPDAFLGTPIAGAGLTADENQPPPNDDVICFADTDPYVRLQPNPAQDVTGANGTCLVLNGKLTGYSFAKTGCNFGPKLLGASVPSVLYVQEDYATCP